MRGTDVVRMALEQSKGWVMGLVTDMRDAPLTAPTPNGGNHPLWVIGHLAYSEGDLIHAWVNGEPNPLSGWKEIFAQGTHPTGDASRYPPLDEVLHRFEEIRSGTLNILASLSDADLDKPSHAPAEMKDYFGTVGQCFVGAALHFTFHGGQVADARRAAGKRPLMG